MKVSPGCSSTMAVDAMDTFADALQMSMLRVKDREDARVKGCKG